MWARVRDWRVGSGVEGVAMDKGVAMDDGGLVEEEGRSRVVRRVSRVFQRVRAACSAARMAAV